MNDGWVLWSKIWHLRCCCQSDSELQLNCKLSMFAVYWSFLCLSGWRTQADNPLPLLRKSEVCSPGLSPQVRKVFLSKTSQPLFCFRWIKSSDIKKCELCKFTFLMQSKVIYSEKYISTTSPRRENPLSQWRLRRKLFDISPPCWLVWHKRARSPNNRLHFLHWTSSRSLLPVSSCLGFHNAPCRIKNSNSEDRLKMLIRCWECC